MELDVLEALNEVGLSAESLDEIKREPLDDAGELLDQEPSFSDQGELSVASSGRRSVSLGQVFEEASHFTPLSSGQGDISDVARDPVRATVAILMDDSSKRGSTWSADVPFSSVLSRALAALNGDDIQESDVGAPGGPLPLPSSNPEMPGTSRQHGRISVQRILGENAGDAPQGATDSGHSFDGTISSLDPKNAVADDTLGAQLGISRDRRRGRLTEVEKTRIVREILANPHAGGDTIATSLASESIQVSPSWVAFIKQKLRKNMPEAFAIYPNEHRFGIRKEERKRAEAIILANPTEGRPSIARRLQQEGIHYSDGGVGKIMRSVKGTQPEAFPTSSSARPTGVRLSEAEKHQLREVIRENPGKTAKAIGELLARRHVYVGRDVIWRTQREERRISAGLISQELSPSMLGESGAYAEFGQLLEKDHSERSRE